MTLLRSEISWRQRRLPLRAVFASALALTLAACGGGESATTLTASSDVAPQRQLELDSKTGSDAPDTKLVQIKELTLPARDRAAPRVIALPALAPQKGEALAEPGRPRQIGVGRLVAQAADPAATAPLLAWARSADGRRLAALSVQSPDARALRLGLRVEQLPPGTQLRVYAPGAEQVVEVAGTEVLRTLQRNLDAGATGAEAYTYWLPTVDGAEAVLEIELAADVDPSLLKVSLPEVSHLSTLPGDSDFALKAAAACNVDVMCTADNDASMRAVAHMIFTEGGNTYICTGTLLNNTKQDGTPYFLSANHCISTQAVASTLETIWNYRSASCNSAQMAGNLQRVGGGAQLLYATNRTDTALLRLNANPPANAVYAGWNANAPTGPNALVFSIHHPAGDRQKYSEGQVGAFANCTLGANNGVSCSESTVAGSTYHAVAWSRGTTEGGSSGGALFSRNGRHVIGQLLGGNGSCEQTRVSVYGRFDLAFNAALAKWLSPSTTTPPPAPGGLAPVYRFYNGTTGAHFYTNNAMERDYVTANLPGFKYEGVSYQAYSGPAASTSAVYRFYNRDSGVHFYTISAGERDYIIATYPSFQYEGPSWYARTTAGGGANPLYRFYNSRRGAHFYTPSAGERDYVVATYPDFAYEGVAYYVWPAP